jgi:hypothetical protein
MRIGFVLFALLLCVRPSLGEYSISVSLSSSSLSSGSAPHFIAAEPTLLDSRYEELLKANLLLQQQIQQLLDIQKPPVPGNSADELEHKFDEAFETRAREFMFYAYNSTLSHPAFVFASEHARPFTCFVGGVIRDLLVCLKDIYGVSVWLYGAVRDYYEHWLAVFWITLGFLGWRLAKRLKVFSVHNSMAFAHISLRLMLAYMWVRVYDRSCGLLPFRFFTTRFVHHPFVWPPVFKTKGSGTIGHPDFKGEAVMPKSEIVPIDLKKHRKAYMGAGVLSRSFVAGDGYTSSTSHQLVGMCTVFTTTVGDNPQKRFFLSTANHNFKHGANSFRPYDQLTLVHPKLTPTTELEWHTVHDLSIAEVDAAWLSRSQLIGAPAIIPYQLSVSRTIGDNDVAVLGPVHPMSNVNVECPTLTYGSCSLRDIKDDEFTFYECHTASTTPGFSGGPVFVRSTLPDKVPKIEGIHLGYHAELGSNIYYPSGLIQEFVDQTYGPKTSTTYKQPPVTLADLDEPLDVGVVLENENWNKPGPKHERRYQDKRQYKRSDTVYNDEEYEDECVAAESLGNGQQPQSGNIPTGAQTALQRGVAPTSQSEQEIRSLMTAEVLQPLSDRLTSLQVAVEQLFETQKRPSVVLESTDVTSTQTNQSKAPAVASTDTTQIGTQSSLPTTNCDSTLMQNLFAHIDLKVALGNSEQSILIDVLSSQNLTTQQQIQVLDRLRAARVMEFERRAANRFPNTKKANQKTA